MKKLMIICALFGLGLSSNAQLKNLDFEEWEHPLSHHANLPSNWTIINDHVYRTPASNTYHSPVSREQAQNGNHALRLGVWYTYTEDIAFQKAPIHTHPKSLDGYYTYTDNFYFNGNTQSVELDSARIWVYLTYWDEASQESIIVGQGFLLLDSTSLYKPFSCPIDYSTFHTPDSITVILDGSLFDRITTTHSSGVPSGISSVFTLDHLTLTDVNSVSIQPEQKTDFKLYPNPAQNELFIEGTSENVHYEILDLSGQLVNERSSGNKSIPVGHLSPGVYFLRFFDGDAWHQLRWIKN